MFDMPFEEYIAYRTRYAIGVAERTKLIDVDYEAIALLQAMWAREYWFNKCNKEN
jgi:hypothetical protein